MATKNAFEYRTPNTHLVDVSFEVFDSAEIERSSCKEIHAPVSFDEILVAVEGGLYDPALGPTDRFAQCKTCGLAEKICPGHIGHITLPLPAYNPTFFRFTLDIVKSSCLKCHRLYILNNAVAVELILAQLRCLNSDAISDVDVLKNNVLHVIRKDTALDEENETPAPKSRKKDADSEMLDVIDSKLDKEESELIVSGLKTIYPDADYASSGDCRNIVDKRRQLIKDFCQQYLFNRPKICPFCQQISQSIRHQYYQSILSGTRKTVWKKDLMKKEDQKPDKSALKPFDDDILPQNEEKRFKTTMGESNGDMIQRMMDDMESQLEELKEIAESLPEGGPKDDIEDEGNGEPKKTTPFAEMVQMAGGGSKFHAPNEIRDHLRLVWHNGGEFLGKLFLIFFNRENSSASTSDSNVCPFDRLFYDVLPVIPNKFRPISRMGSMIFENAQTGGYKRVLECCKTIRQLIQIRRDGDSVLDEIDAEKAKNKQKQTEMLLKSVPGRNFDEKMHLAYLQLQQRINGLYDSDLDKLNKVPVPGVRQLLEKKEGLFRKHMMGKRVNYACRTVITPDPYQDMDQIGVPDIFSKRLTFPECVNSINLSKMQHIVEQGPNKIVGANYVVNEDGDKVRLDPDNSDERSGVAKRLLFTDQKSLRGCKKVYRHLMDGDVMLLNRQPTLHRPSIQAHRARILQNQKVMRLHYAVCKPYNADFDGDEMNAHFPQSELARAEGYEIASVPFQYLVPKDGTPILGLIQDHIVSGVLLTMKDRLFSKEDYQYLVLNAFGYLDKKLKFLKPCILKPVVRWSGKQIVSTVILNVIPSGNSLLNLSSKSKTSVKSWQISGRPVPDFEMSESQVIFRNGELLCGVLDKADYGPTAFGLVHWCYELYHPNVAARLLSCFSRLFTTFLQYHGFSLGVADVLVSDKANRKRQEILKNLRQCGLDTMKNVLHLSDVKTSSQNEAQRLVKEKMKQVYTNEDKSHIKELDYAMKMATDKFNDQVNKACLPHGLLKVFPENSLQCMIESGAKGNMVNQVQMSCMLGQIELEGCRPPLTPSGRTLPSFEPYDWSPRAGGFVDGRFATGIKPQEFFFHTMAGREGLIDTAVKTSRSGYLQRCIIKHLEGVMVNYDLTVRDSDRSVVQFRYGEDGCDIGRVQYLAEDKLPRLAHNIGVLKSNYEKFSAFHSMDCKESEKLNKKIRRWRKKFAEKSQQKQYNAPFTIFSSQNPHLSDKNDAAMEFRNLDQASKDCYAARVCPDPVASLLNPQTNFGAIPETLLLALDSLPSGMMDKMPRGWTNEDEEHFRRLIYWKSTRALSEPGDPVGIVAAQSIGEPSTQMTLNTFHFAGRGEMNVTLGIPRLREILMTASAKIATPTAQVPVLPKVDKTVAEELKRQMDRLKLKQFISAVRIYENVKVQYGVAGIEYTIRLEFLKRKNRQDETRHISNKNLIARLEGWFYKQLASTLNKMIRQSRSEIKIVATKAKRRNVENVPVGAGRDANLDEEVQDDADAADAKRFERQNDENEYVGEAEEKDEIMPSDAENSSDEEEKMPDVSIIVDSPNEISSIVEEQKIDQEKPTAVVNVARVKNVLFGSPLLLNYDYDAERHMWSSVVMTCPLDVGSIDINSIVSEEVERFVIQETTDIQRCLLREENGKLILQTEGINLKVFSHMANFLDINKISCNDIHTIARTYGIEAATRALIREIKMVFGAYGITVDHRHLSLVTDYMTHTGTYMPFNRTYMGTSASPMQKMSFETTTAFLKDAIYAGEKEDLKSPSAQIIVGAMPTFGTGCFDLMVDLKMKK